MTFSILGRIEGGETRERGYTVIPNDLLLSVSSAGSKGVKRPVWNSHFAPAEFAFSILGRIEGGETGAYSTVGPTAQALSVSSAGSKGVKLGDGKLGDWPLSVELSVSSAGSKGVKRYP